MEEFELKIFPWERNEKPISVNENGIHWYLEKSLTRYCNVKINKIPKLNAVVYLLAKKVNGKIEPITRAIVDIKTNKLLDESPSMEELAQKIDIMRLTKMGQE